MPKRRYLSYLLEIQAALDHHPDLWIFYSRAERVAVDRVLRTACLQDGGDLVLKLSDRDLEDITDELDPRTALKAWNSRVGRIAQELRNAGGASERLPSLKLDIYSSETANTYSSRHTVRWVRFFELHNFKKKLPTLSGSLEGTRKQPLRSPSTDHWRGDPEGDWEGDPECEGEGAEGGEKTGTRAPRSSVSMKDLKVP